MCEFCAADCCPAQGAGRVLSRLADSHTGMPLLYCREPPLHAELAEGVTTACSHGGYIDLVT
jgi:hypothetical protein